MDTIAVVVDASGIMETDDNNVEAMVVQSAEEDEEVIQAEDALLDSAANEASLEGTSKKR